MGVTHQFGVKGGLNSSTLNVKPSIQQESTLGMVLGVAYVYMPSKAAGVVVEALFAQYGWTEKFDDPSMKYGRTMNYIDLPVMSNFIIGSGKGHGKINFGPRVSLLLSESEETNIQGSQERYYYGRPIEDNLEMGLTFGGGYSRILPIGEVQFDIRLAVTFSNLWEAPDDLEVVTTQNQGVAFTLTYWIKTF